MSDHAARRPVSRNLFGRARRSSELAAGPEVVPDETLNSRRLLYYLALGLVLVSFPLQQPVLFVAGWLIGVVVALPEVWYRFGLRALRLEHTLSARRAVFGDTVEVALVVENRKLLPLPWLVVDDQFPDALPVIGVRLRSAVIPERARLRNTIALWAYQRVRRRYRVRAVARGSYAFGPIELSLSDPFGILTRDERREVTSTLLVYPPIAPIERFGLSARAPFGEYATPQHLLEDPLRVAGTRAYAPGDEPRRIHWKATARTGSLQSKVYEPSARHTVCMFLDLRTFKNVAFGYLPELVELAISAAASVAQWAIEQGYAVGLISNGTLAQADADSGASSAVTLRLRIAPSSRAEQLSLILDGLARLFPYYGMPIDQMIASEQRSLPAGATVVYIGSESILDVPAILALRQLKARGHAVSALLTSDQEQAGAGAEDRAEGRPEEHVLHLADLPVHYIGGAAAWHALVADVLGPESLRRASSDLGPLVSAGGHTDDRTGNRNSALRGIPFSSDAGDVSERSTHGSATDRAGGEQREERPATPRPLVLE